MTPSGRPGAAGNGTGGGRTIGDRPTVRIGLVQSACTADREANIAAALAGIATAAGQGAEVVCLQELFAGEYPCQDESHARFAEAEPVPGPLITIPCCN